MNRNILLLLILLCLPAATLTAQSVAVEAKIDSVQLFIGEQTAIRLQATVNSGTRVTFPLKNVGDTLVKGVEIVEIVKPDTQFLNNKQRLLIEQAYIVTSFDSALYYLPPMMIEADTIRIQTNPLALKVYSVPVDTLHPEMFFGQKANMKAPFVWSDWYGLLAGSFLTIPLLILLIYLIVRLCDNKPVIRKIKVEPKLPPHQAALTEIERIKTEKVWQQGRQKEYYTELTNAIRHYITERFRFDALEMTSSEIIGRLLEFNDKAALKELQELFATADLVKFAKHHPLTNENDANLICAIGFIDQTKQSESELPPQPTEITVIEKRSLRAKILLGCAITLLSALLIGIYIYICLLFLS